MTFVQIIDCKTDKADDISRLLDKWVEQTHGRRTATHATLAKDRADTSHVIEIVEFPSYEEAMANSRLPETDRVFQEMVALCDAPPRFTDLDVVRDEQPNKLLVNRFFDLVAGGSVDRLGEVLSERYHEHDPANGQDVRGIQAAREQVEMYRAAFPDFRFTFEDQIAEGDRVCTRWTWRGTHTGEFMGIQATNRPVTMAGQTIHRLMDGKIEEAWFNYDFLGALRQLGVLQMPGQQ